MTKKDSCVGCVAGIQALQIWKTVGYSVIMTFIGILFISLFSFIYAVGKQAGAKEACQSSVLAADAATIVQPYSDYKYVTYDAVRLNCAVKYEN